VIAIHPTYGFRRNKTINLKKKKKTGFRLGPDLTPLSISSLLVSEAPPERIKAIITQGGQKTPTLPQDEFTTGNHPLNIRFLLPDASEVRLYVSLAACDDSPDRFRHRLRKSQASAEGRHCVEPTNI
jgi:hypothetical protein